MQKFALQKPVKVGSKIVRMCRAKILHCSEWGVIGSERFSFYFKYWPKAWKLYTYQMLHKLWIQLPKKFYDKKPPREKSWIRQKIFQKTKISQLSKERWLDFQGPM